MEMGHERRWLPVVAARSVALVWMIAVAVVAGGTAPPVATAAEPAAPPQLYVIADSVVLGARDALVREFPGYQVTVDGVPAIWTDVAAELAWERRDHIGDIAVVATGY